MINKDSPSLIKLDIKDKAAVYDTLFSKADKSLKAAKTVALLYLGSPYYVCRLLEEYNNINKVYVFTNKEFKFIYEPFEKCRNVKIWYVDDEKDTFKGCDMKFDCIIMNPPYERNLHLKILAEAIKHLKDEKSVCVNLSPIPRLTSVRNLYDDKTIKRNKQTTAYQHLNSIEQIANGIELFNAGIQQDLGIQLYSKVKHAFDVEQYVNAALPKTLTKKIMAKCMKLSVLNAVQFGKFELPISDIHGHSDLKAKDKYNIMALSYERQLKSAGRIKIRFKTDEDRKSFYDFWMSPFGKLIVSLWKVDTNVEHRYIPYAWFKSNDECYKFFNITPDEQKIIEETMEKYR